MLSDEELPFRLNQSHFGCDEGVVFLSELGGEFLVSVFEFVGALAEEVELSSVAFEVNRLGGSGVVFT